MSVNDITLHLVRIKDSLLTLLHVSDIFQFILEALLSLAVSLLYIREGSGAMFLVMIINLEWTVGSHERGVCSVVILI